jgi:hypothetical protein
LSEIVSKLLWTHGHKKVLCCFVVRGTRLESDLRRVEVGSLYAVWLCL